MTSQSSDQQLKECCVGGHIHSGTPRGTVEEVGGCKTYIAKPSNAADKSKTVIFLTDIFGYELPNIRLVADEYAEKGGFYVLVPDLFQGDYVDHGLLKAIVPQQSDPEPSIGEKAIQGAQVAANLGPWVIRHREAISKPIIEKFVSSIRNETSHVKIGTVGFCWGGRYAILMASDNDYPHLDCSIANHPAFLSVPDELKVVNKPVLIQVGDADAMMPVAQVEEAQKIFQDKTNAQVAVYPGAVHGFAARGDQNNEKEKQQKTDATDAAIKFLQKHLS